MFLLNKKTSASRSTSSEFLGEEGQDPNENMDVYMYTGASAFPSKKTKEKRQKARSSFFGGSKKQSVDERDHIYGNTTSDSYSPRSPSRLTVNDRADSESAFMGKRRLRKVSSKTSLASSNSYPTSISSGDQREERTKSKSRFTSSLFSSGAWAPPPQQLQFVQARQKSPSSPQSNTPGTSSPSISQPFDFAHISHHDTSEAARIGESPRDLGQEWNRALHRESQIRPLRSQSSTTSLHSRGASVDVISSKPPSIGVRLRSGSTNSLSPAESFNDRNFSTTSPTSPALRDSGSRHNCPITPPLRASSRHCLRIAEHPEEEEEQETAHRNSQPRAGENDDVPDDLGLMYGGEEVGAAVTTVGQSSYGRKSIGIEKLLINPVIGGHRISDTDFPSPPSPTNETEVLSVEQLVRQVRSTPDFNSEDSFGQLPSQNTTLLTVRARPLSQLSLVSDTLNGNFTVPAAPIMRHASVRERTRRVSITSRRFSTHRRSTSHGALAAAAAENSVDSWEQDIDWMYSAEAEEEEVVEENYGEQGAHEWDHYPPSSSSNPDRPPPPSSAAPDVHSSLQPPSSPTSPLRQRIAEAALSMDRQKPHHPNPDHPADIRRITGLFEDRLLLPPSPAFPPSSVRDSGFALSYREELSKVARQLDEHIAALNSSRMRANSQTTCVTLCSDTDTITPTDSNEAITPASSNHSSLQWRRSNSVVGAGVRVEGRIEKGVSFPAAAIPGVVEIGPGWEGDAGISEEFVHFI